jgi:ammonia channel protein AmtB
MVDLSSFLSVIAAVSVAVERIVEILKGSLPNFWLFKQPMKNPAQEPLRCALLHVLAGICGTFVAAMSRIDIWQTLGQSHLLGGTTDPYYWWSSFGFTGLLSSGGSAIWNHALDILKAAKVTQEQQAKALTAANVAQSASANGSPQPSNPDAIFI